MYIAQRGLGCGKVDLQISVNTGKSHRTQISWET